MLLLLLEVSLLRRAGLSSASWGVPGEGLLQHTLEAAATQTVAASSCEVGSLVAHPELEGKEPPLTLRQENHYLYFGHFFPCTPGTFSLQYGTFL